MSQILAKYGFNVQSVQMTDSLMVRADVSAAGEEASGEAERIV